MSKLVRGLERAGLVERSGHPSDTRAVQLSLSPAGSEVAARAIDRVRGLEGELTAALGGAADPRVRELRAALLVLLGPSDPIPRSVS